MRGRTVAAASAAASLGVIAFIVVQISSIDRDGVEVGVRHATACDESDEHECLPEIAMEDTEGEVWDGRDFGGEVVIVNFWATWCRPCLEEIPDLASLYEDYRDRNVVLLGVVMDSPSEDELTAFAERTGLNYPVVRSSPELIRGFELPGVLPTTYVYDRGGRLVKQFRGAVTAQQMSALVDELLAETPPEPREGEATAS